jgi:dienelactone hydrolase
MRRRNLIFGLSAAMAGALAGCTTDGDPPTRVAAAPATATPTVTTPDPTANPTPATTTSTAPVFASTKRSLLKAQPVTPYVPVAGTAPAAPFAVGRRDTSFRRGAARELPVRIWYPAVGTAGGGAVDNLSPATGPFAAVVFSHGLRSHPEDFDAMLTRFARAGIVVVAPAYPHTNRDATDYDSADVINQPADASHVLTELLKLTDPLVAAINPERLGAAGHSGGGITTAGLLSRARDTRLKAGIIINGTDFTNAPFAGPATAVLMVHGRNDDTVAYAAGHTVFEAVPWSRAMLTITDGGHDVTSTSFEPTTQTSVEFLHWSLYGDAAAKARIPEKAAVGGVATLENQL